MTTVKNKISFPDEIRIRLKNLITSRSGIYFKDYDLGDLEDAVAARMQTLGFDTVLGYYTHITTSGEREDEFRELLNHLTIKHTYFFRNEAQFKALREKILPEIIKRKMQLSCNAEAFTQHESKPSLRIWSAGCSTGEEPYSIAMTVHEALGDSISGWDIQIIATDASTDALARARGGVYSESSVKNVDEGYLARYFDVTHGAARPSTIWQDHDRPERSRRTTGRGPSRAFVEERCMQYAVRNEVKQIVTFSYHNLIEDEFPAGFDIIFCRNVVIYFELDTTMKVMEKFYSSLSDDGYIFIGYSESLYFMQEKFKMVSWDEAIYYRKGAKEALPHIDTAKAQRPVEKTLDEAIEELSRAELLAEIEIEAKKAKPPPKKMEEVLVQAMKSFHMKDYAKALAFVSEALAINKNTIDPYYLAAEIYTDQGKFADAKERLAEALKLNSLFAPAHYLFGCIFIEESALDKAKESLKRALYIDKDFSLAHFYLAPVAQQKTGNWTFAAGTYSGVWYITGNATINNNVTINGTLIARGGVSCTGNSTVRIIPSSPNPAVISEGNLNFSRTTDLVMSGVVYAGADGTGSINLSRTGTVSINGTLIAGNDINLSRSDRVTITYDNAILTNPPAGFSGGGSGGTVAPQKDWNEVPPA